MLLQPPLPEMRLCGHFTRLATLDRRQDPTSAPLQVATMIGHAHGRLAKANTKVAEVGGIATATAAADETGANNSKARNPTTSSRALRSKSGPIRLP